MNVNNNNDKRTVLVVNIITQNSGNLFLSCHKDLLEKLEAHPTLQVELVDSIALLQLKCIEYNPKTTVLVFVNELVTDDDHLADILFSFVKGGALAILCCLCAAFAKPQRTNRFFELLGLKWKLGPDAKAKVSVSPVGRFVLSDFEESFFAEGTTIMDVLPQQMLYTMDVQSMTNPHLLVQHCDPTMSSTTMVAFAKSGKGAIACVGNFTLEKRFYRLIVALCSGY